MPNKKLKRIMTDLAAGHISQEEADKLLGKKPEEVVNQNVEGVVNRQPKSKPSKTQKRKTKSLGGKK